MENFNKLIPIDGENGEKRTISSLEIAELTGKRHDAILRDIRNLLNQGVNAHNFVEVEYTDKKGEKRPCYELTKKGCLILAKDWLSNKSTKEFLSTLSAVRTIPLTGLVDKAFKKILFSFGSLRNCCTFVVLQLTIKYANGLFYARKETYILKYRQTISVYHRPMAMVGCSKLGYLSAFLFNNK